MIFEYDLIKGHDIKNIDLPDGRIYILPSDKKVPSVTTVIGRMLPKEHLEAWRERIGDEAADNVMKQACRRGTIIHNLLEDYVLGRPVDLRKQMPFHRQTFKDIRQIIDDNIDKIYASELGLFDEDFLYTAGRSDLLARFKGEDAICDFKTSKSEKSEKDILGYFIQATIYAIMAEKLYGFHAKKIVIMMSIDEGRPVTFVKNPKDYLEQSIEMFRTYRKRNEDKFL